MSSVPPRAVAAAAVQSSGMVPMTNNNRHPANEEGRSGWPADPLRCQVPPAGINACSLSKQKFLARQELSASKDALFSSSNLLGQSSGSFRRPDISNSRELKDSEAETSRSRTPDGRSGAFQVNAPPHRTSQLAEYLGLRSTKNYDSTLMGIQGINFDPYDRIHN